MQLPRIGTLHHKASPNRPQVERRIRARFRYHAEQHKMRGGLEHVSTFTAYTPPFTSPNTGVTLHPQLANSFNETPITSHTIPTQSTINYKLTSNHDEHTSETLHSQLAYSFNGTAHPSHHKPTQQIIYKLTSNHNVLNTGECI